MLIPEVIAALRELNEHPDTVFTVLTGEGRFFSAGADVRNVSSLSQVWPLNSIGDAASFGWFVNEKY